MVTSKYLTARLNFLKENPYLIVIIIGVLVRIPLLFSYLTFNSDAWRQADTASIAHHFYINGYKILYPQIYWGGNSPGYVETEFQLYTFITSIMYYFFGEQYWLGRLVSLGFSTLAWLFFYKLAMQVLGEARQATWALFFLVFSPLYLRYSVAYMPEATVMFFYIAALYFFVTWLKSSNQRHLILASASTALAILVKPTSIHIGFLFALLALGAFGVKVLKRREIWLAMAIALTPGTMWYIHARNLYLAYGNTFGILSGGDSKFGSVEQYLGIHLYTHLVRLDWKWVLGYGYILLFLAGLVMAWSNKRFRLVPLGVIVVGIYYLLVPRYAHEDWGIQYHVYMIPFAALAIGLGVAWVTDSFKGITRTGILLSSVIVSLGITAVVFRQMLLTGEGSLAQCGSSVKEVVPADARIIVSTTSYALDNGIPNNYQEPQIFFYSQRYGWSLPADWHTVEKLVEYRNNGASYFVMYSERLLNSNPLLMDYLDNNSIQIGPGIERGCAIFAFVQQTEQIQP